MIDGRGGEDICMKTEMQGVEAGRWCANRDTSREEELSEDAIRGSEAPQSAEM